MDNNNLVTIAIPFFNSERYLSFAIQSVINQSYSEWELILIDDGSSDCSKAISESYAQKDIRIRVVSDGFNKGLATRLNETISLAKGNFYVRMDADDVMDSNRLEKQLKFLNTHNDVDVVGTSAVIIGENNEILYSVKDDISAPRTKQDVERGLIFIHPSVAGKTSWFKEHPYDEKLKRSQDFFLWLNSVDSSTFEIIKESLLFYRVVNEDIWGKFKRDNRVMLKYYRSQFSLNHFWHPLWCCLRQQARLPLFWLFYKIKGSDGVIRRRYKVLSDEEKKQYSDRLKMAIK